MYLFTFHKGLGQYTENPLENCHKYLREFRTNLARKTSEDDNLTDCFKRLYLMSSSFIRSQNTPKKSPQREISFKFSDDKLVESFFCKDGDIEE